MKKYTKLIPVIFIAFTLAALCAFSGCGDDGSTTFSGYTGTTGATGEDGATGATGAVDLSSITVTLWEDTDVPINTYRLTLTRAFQTSSDEEVIFESLQTGNSHTFTDLLPGDYELKINALGHLPLTKKFTLVGGRPETKDVIFEENVRLYGVYGRGRRDVSPTTGILFLIDPNTGDMDSVGDTGFYEVGGMDFHPETGILYATAFSGISVHKSADDDDDSEFVLITINPLTGEGTLVNTIDLAEGYYCYDLSFDSGGNLYGIFSQSGNNVELGIVNITTGTVQIINSNIGSYYFRGNGLAFSSGGTLYWAGENYNTDESYLYTLDKTNGSILNTVSLTDRHRYEALDFQPETGTLFGFESDDYTLSAIDPSTGTEEPVGYIDYFDALAFPPVETP